MKAKRLPKLQLDNKQLEVEFFEDVALFGVVSALEPSTCAHWINKYTPFHFTRNHDMENIHQNEYYPVFYFNQRIKHTEHVLFTNRSINTYLLPEVKNVDYIWLVKSGSFLKEIIPVVAEVLHDIPGIDYFVPLELDRILSKQWLII